MDIYHNGTTDEKNEFSFGLLDEAGEAEITFEELKHVMKKFLAFWASILGQKGNLDERSLRHIFDKLVKPGSQILSLKRYKKMLKSDPQLGNWIDVCLSDVHQNLNVDK